MSLAYELTACTACGARDTRVVADAETLRSELESLWAFHTRRLVTGTPPRHLADRIAFSQPLAVRLVQCVACGLVYRNPIERAHEVHDLYAGEAPADDVLAALHATQRDALRAEARRLTSVVGRAGTVLEVGSYVGGFLSAAEALGWTVVGVDVNPAVNAWVRARGPRVIDGELADVAGVRADVVAFWNCFDQLADPAAALRDAHARTGDTGRVVVRVPNGDAYVRLRSAARGFRAAADLVLATNNLLAFPYRYGFTPTSLRRLFARAGFDVERVIGDTLVPLADRWTRPWARAEERLAKRVTRMLSRAGLLPPPWIEVYGRKR